MALIKSRVDLTIDAVRSPGGGGTGCISFSALPGAIRGLVGAPWCKSNVYDIETAPANSDDSSVATNWVVSTSFLPFVPFVDQLHDINLKLNDENVQL